MVSTAQSIPSFYSTPVNIFLANLLLRACAAVALVAALAGCAHQASTISVNKQQQEPIKLGAMEFVFMPAGFDSPKARGELAGVGYHTGVFAHELSRVVKKVFLANGIDATMLRPGDASPVPPPPYRMVTRPTSLTTQTGNMGSFTTMDMVVTLQQHGVTQPVWTGALSIPVSQGQMYEVNYGNFALAVLNALQTSGVAALPQGHAVTPNGNKNYRLDVPTVLTDKSATGG